MSYIFVVYSSKTAPSGRALAREMKTQLLKAGKQTEVRFGRHKLLVLAARKKIPLFIVNVGETQALPSGIPVINAPARVIGSSNKRGCRVRFKEAGVPAPELWLTHNVIPKNKFPVVGRTTHHSKARGFWYCTTPAQAKRAAAAGATHFLQFIKNTREFRVHVFCSSIKPSNDPSSYVSVKLSEKLPKSTKTDKNAIIKNHDSGWVFMFPKDDKSNAMRQSRAVAKQALASAELHFGAVDVMVSEDTGKPYVLEINSAPCLTDETADTSSRYASWVLHQTGLIKKPVPAPKPKIMAAKKTVWGVPKKRSNRRPVMNKKDRAALRTLLAKLS